MATVKQVIASLEKLYAKRSALDEKIIEVEKKLLPQTTAESMPAAPVKKAPATVKKAAITRKTRTRKTTLK